MKRNTPENDIDIRDMVIRMHDLELSLTPPAEELQARYVLSDEFYENMERLIQRMIRRRCRLRRIHYAVGWAAALLLTFCILRMSNMIEAGWNVTEWFEEHAMFHFREQGSSDTLPEYELGYVPENYVLTDSFYSENTGYLQYSAGGQSLTLLYGRTSAHYDVDTENKEYKKIKTNNGVTVYLFTSSTDSESSMIWLSDDEQTCFTLTGYLPKEELLRIQENIYEKNSISCRKMFHFYVI